MSLFDALLLDEYHDPKDIWATPRVDGLRGAGSATDPYDTGELAGLPQTLTALTHSGTDLICRTAAKHGYLAGDMVSIVGVLGQNASAFNLVNVTLTAAMIVSPRALRLPLASIPAAAIYPRCNPELVKGGVSVSVELFWPVAKATLPSSGFRDFDAISIQGCVDASYNGIYENVAMSADGNSFYYRLGVAVLPPATASVLGTCFRYTYRYDEVMKVLPENSLIRVGATTAGSAIKSRGQANLYLEDDGLSYQIGYMAKSGQRILGSGVDATTFKVVHAMSSVGETSFLGYATKAVYELVLFEATDFTSDCDIAGQAVPYQGVSAPTVPFPGVAPVVTGAAGPLRGRHNRLRRLRAINFGTQAYPECFVLSLHGYSNLISINNAISDCITERPGINNYHGSTLILANASGRNYPSIDASVFVADGRAAVVRNCYCNVYYPNAGFLGEGASSAPIKITAIVRVGATEFFEVTTAENHNRVVGNIFNVSRVLNDMGDPHPVFDGSFLVTERIDDTKVKVRIPGAPTSIPPANLTSADTRVEWHGPGTNSGSGYVTEGNAAYDCTFPIYEDSSATRDQVYRNNYYSGGLYGANVNLAPGRGFTGNPISAVARPDAVGQPKWVRITCLNNTFIRWLKDGDVVYLEGILDNGVSGGVYIGRFTIRNVDQINNRFDFDTKTTPAGAPSLGTTPPPNFFYVFRWPRIVFENCQFDDWVRKSTSFGFSRGILGAPADDSATGPNVILPDWLVRENEFRHVDGTPSEVASDQAVVIANTDGAVVDSNLVSLSGTPLVDFKRAQNVMAFGNRTETGAWIRGWFAPTGQYLEDITTRIEDVMSACF